MNSISTEVSKCYDILKEQTLEKNDKSTATWYKYKSDLNITKSLLESFPKKVTEDVMVPIGPKALMRGKVVHSNEFLVNLGETWFVKRTSQQTIEICNRRIKTCDEMISNLDKERELIMNKTIVPDVHEAFGNEERPEIIEYATEEENEEWKKLHQIRVKEYHQQLAELRNKEKKSIESEEDLWKHLDELELQEELEDELNRLNSDFCSGEEMEEYIPSESELEGINNEESEVEKLSKKENITNNKVKRKVSFASDLSLSNDEPLLLEVKHSVFEPKPKDPNQTEIISPSDIYEKFFNNLQKMPLSVLKSDSNPNQEKELKILQNMMQLENEKNSEDEDSVKNIPFVTTGIKFNDVVERQIFCDKVNSENKKSQSKKVSKFKAVRIKK